MPMVPTVYGLLVEHTEEVLRDAEQEMQSHLSRLRPGYRKAQQVLVQIGRLWSGFDGTKAMRGPRVLPTEHTVRQVASLLRDTRHEVRTQTLAELEWAAELVAAVLDDILIALDDVAPVVRFHAARLLAHISDGVPDTAIDQLRARLDDPAWSVRWMVVPVLVGRISPSILVDVMLATVPTAKDRDETLHDWLRAANTISPITLELADRIRDVEAIAARMR